MVVTLVNAMSADGKIAPVERIAPVFGEADGRRLEQLCAKADALVFGAGTLRSYGTTFRITSTDLAAARRVAGKPEQPLSVVVTASGSLDPELPFFRSQQVPRAIATTDRTARRLTPKFQGVAEVWACGASVVEVPSLRARLADAGAEQVVLLGGGKLNADWFAADAVDYLELTIAAVLFGGKDAPTIIDGPGLDGPRPLRLESAETVEQMLFLRYQVVR